MNKKTLSRFVKETQFKLNENPGEIIDIPLGNLNQANYLLENLSSYDLINQGEDRDSGKYILQIRGKEEIQHA